MYSVELNPPHNQKKGKKEVYIFCPLYYSLQVLHYWRAQGILRGIYCKIVCSVYLNGLSNQDERKKEKVETTENA